MENTSILYKVIEGKTITWFENNNEYIIFENTTADILKRIHKGIDTKKISEALAKKLSVPLEKAIDFVLQLENKIYDNRAKSIALEILSDYRDARPPTSFEYSKYYQVNDLVFKVDYFTEKELSLVHPKFAHLEVENLENYNHLFQVYTNNRYTFLFVDNQFIGAWSKQEIHYFQGKFSMELIQKIHQKAEEEWMGVFHASALSNGKKSILFLGDSGNGKSTSLALLQNASFTCLADDFVPIDIKNKHVYSFPASISIKKNSLETLLPVYPELATSAEYHFENLNKTVRYLPPQNDDFSTNLPCQDLVFIKYQKESDLQFSEMSKLEAFQQLVPDSWLSPIKENAQQFLDWFETVNCYQLTYSDNEKMIEKVNQIFNNEL